MINVKPLIMFFLCLNISQAMAYNSIFEEFAIAGNKNDWATYITIDTPATTSLNPREAEKVLRKVKKQIMSSFRTTVRSDGGIILNSKTETFSIANFQKKIENYGQAKLCHFVLFENGPLNTLSPSPFVNTFLNSNIKQLAVYELDNYDGLGGCMAIALAENKMHVLAVFND